MHELAPRLAQACEVLLASVAQEPEVMVDRQLGLAEVWQAHRQLPTLAPFGIDNVKPLFMFSGLIISKLKVFGKNKDHLELSLSQGAASAMGIAFFSTPESFQKPLVEGMRADVVGHVEMDWRGGPRVRVVDVL